MTTNTLAMAVPTLLQKDNMRMVMKMLTMRFNPEQQIVLVILVKHRMINKMTMLIYAVLIQFTVRSLAQQHHQKTVDDEETLSEDDDLSMINL